VFLAYGQSSVRFTINFSRFVGGDKDSIHGVSSAPNGRTLLVGSSAIEGKGNDIVILALDSKGQTEWMRYFGGNQDDFGYAIECTSDSGFVFTGSTHSYGSGGDIFLIKMNAKGEMEWFKYYGNENSDVSRSVCQTDNGSYLIGGYTTKANGDRDGIVILTDANGNLLWTKNIGGEQHDEVTCVKQCSDRNFIVAGFTASEGNGKEDAFLRKLNTNGADLWNDIRGGAENDRYYSVSPTGDGGFISCGYTMSFGEGGKDALLIKTNSQGAMEWYKTYGGPCEDKGIGAFESPDLDGYIVPVVTLSFGSNDHHMTLLKVDMKGNVRSSTMLPGLTTSDWLDFDLSPTGTISIITRVNSLDYAEIGIIQGVFTTFTPTPSKSSAVFNEHFTCIPSLEHIRFTENYGNFCSVDDVEEALLAAPEGGWDKCAEIFTREFSANRIDSIVTVHWHVKFPTEYSKSWRENNKHWLSLCDSAGRPVYTIGYKPNRPQDAYTSPDIWLVRDDGSQSSTVLQEASTHRISPHGSDADYMKFKLVVHPDGSIRAYCDFRDGKGLEKYIDVHDMSYADFNSLHFKYKTGKASEGHYTIYLDGIHVKTTLPD